MLLYREQKRLILVVTGNEQTLERNITDLVAYIQYNNFEVTDSKIYSIFDYLYKQYTEARKLYLKNHPKVSKYDSENLMYSLIEDILAENKYASLDVVCHFPLNKLIRSSELLSDEERRYVAQSGTHVDFLIYSRLGKSRYLLSKSMDMNIIRQNPNRLSEIQRKIIYLSCIKFHYCGFVQMEVEKSNRLLKSWKK